MRRSAPITVVFYYPQTEASKNELARRVAEIHTNSVFARLKKLHCPTAQKKKLLDAVIATAKSRIKDNATK